MKLLDALSKVTGVGDCFERGRRPERIGGVEAQLGRQVKRFQQHRLRVRSEQSDSRARLSALDLAKAARQSLVEKLVHREGREKLLQRALGVFESQALLRPSAQVGLGLRWRDCP